MKKLIEYTMLACILFIVVDLTSCKQERIATAQKGSLEFQSEVLNSAEWQEALNQDGTIIVSNKSQGMQHAEERRVLVLSLENQ